MSYTNICIRPSIDDSYVEKGAKIFSSRKNFAKRYPAQSSLKIAPRLCTNFGRRIPISCSSQFKATCLPLYIPSEFRTNRTLYLYLDTVLMKGIRKWERETERERGEGKSLVMARCLRWLEFPSGFSDLSMEKKSRRSYWLYVSC